jgi:hypothetical protein
MPVGFKIAFWMIGIAIVVSIVDVLVEGGMEARPLGCVALFSVALALAGAIVSLVTWIVLARRCE